MLALLFSMCTEHLAQQLADPEVGCEEDQEGGGDTEEDEDEGHGDQAGVLPVAICHGLHTTGQGPVCAVVVR